MTDDDFADAFAESLNGIQGGTTSGDTWTCACGEKGRHPVPGLGLYIHRKNAHPAPKPKTDTWAQKVPILFVGPWRLTIGQRTTPTKPKRWVVTLLKLEDGHVVRARYLPLWRVPPDPI